MKTELDIKQKPLFRFLSEEEKEKILELGERRLIEQGKTVLKEGENNADLYLINKGIVKIIKEEKNQGARTVIGYIQSGGYFGEISLFLDTPASATIYAERDLQLYVLSKEKLQNLFSEKPEIELRFIKGILAILAERIKTTTSMYNELKNAQ